MFVWDSGYLKSQNRPIFFKLRISTLHQSSSEHYGEC